jgi:hypothetical protein
VLLYEGGRRILTQRRVKKEIQRMDAGKQNVFAAHFQRRFRSEDQPALDNWTRRESIRGMKNCG